MTNGQMFVRTEERYTPGKLLLPALALAFFVTQPSFVIVTMLLIDIGHTFSLEVGVTGQLSTVAFLVTTISSVFVGAWSVHFNHKSLLLMGLGVIGISAVGCALAVNFSILLIVYALSGLGMALVYPMTFSLVAEHFPLEKRGRAISWINASMTIAGIIGGPITGFIARIGGWRWTFLGFMMPPAMLSLILVMNEIPSSIQSPRSMGKAQNFFEGFKGLLVNHSATACLIGSIFFMAGWQAILVYGISLFRELFDIPLGFASAILFIAASCALLGTLVSGKLLTKVGRKRLTILSSFGAGIFILVYTNMPDLWLTLIFMVIACVFTGVWFTAGSSLSLEQVPSFRGTMMSIQRAAMSLGSAIGAGVGGVTLLVADYRALGLSLGALGLLAAVIYYFFTVDPTREPSS